MSVSVIFTKGFWRITAFILALGLLSLLIAQFVVAEEIPAARTPAIALPATPVLVTQSVPTVTRLARNCYVVMDFFQTQMALAPTSDATQRASVQSKIHYWETLAPICETVTPPTPGARPQFTPWTPPPFETGIFEGQPGAYFHAYEARIENHWRGLVDGERVFVIAGVSVTNPGQGFLAVLSKPDPPGGRIIFSYPSSTKAGALRILEAQGVRLVIQQAESDALLYFDVIARVFVESLEAVAIPSTPTPTLDPTLLAYPLPGATYP